MARRSLPEIRDMLAEDFDRLYPVIIKSLEDDLDAKKMISVKCVNPKCGRSNSVPVADVRSRVAAAEWLFSHGYGRAATQKDPPPAVKANVGDLSELTDEQLMALLEEGEPDAD